MQVLVMKENQHLRNHMKEDKIIEIKRLIINNGEVEDGEVME
jgi:hypothetical protein